MVTPAPELLRHLFDVATDAALPQKCIKPFLPDAPKGRTIVVGAGKAAAAMARAVEENWTGELSGVVVTRYGHSVPTQKIEVLEASHPVPDQAGLDASKRILESVQGLSEDDLVLCLISGGGSALLSLPADGITLDDKAALTDQLLRSGATITEMNCVRKHLSAIKGGRLAMACHPARVVSLIISDVPGDDLSSIASGATVPDPSTYADARQVLHKYGITPPAAISDLLKAEPDETPVPGSPCFDGVENVLIATPQMSLGGAQLGEKSPVQGWLRLQSPSPIPAQARCVLQTVVPLAQRPSAQTASRSYPRFTRVNAAGSSSLAWILSPRAVGAAVSESAGAAKTMQAASATQANRRIRSSRSRGTRPENPPRPPRSGSFYPYRVTCARLRR